MTDYATVRWGILGAGNIAKAFAKGVLLLPDAKLTAVGSRDAAKSNTFADEFHIPNRHDSYQALVQDPEVDVVYVATPHPFHKEHTLLALNAGKAVLCEKPFTINAAETQTLIETARAKKLFLLEGMWSRFFPLMGRLRDLLKENAIGEPRLLQADFGFRAGFNPQSRLFDPALGGGGLLDVGVYPISLASMIFGTPDRITGLATLGETGIDESAVMALGYPGGALAALTTGVRINTPQAAVLLGTDGRITLPSPWWKPTKLIVSRSGQPDEVIEETLEGTGFQFEAQHVAECLRAGKTESDILPLDESLSIMRTLDTLRAQYGVKYPME